MENNLSLSSMIFFMKVHLHL